MELRSKVVFLDRDGVLNSTSVENGKPYAPTHYKDFHLFEETLPATVALKKAGFLLVVVTNQPDVGNGVTNCSEVKKMNEHLIEVLPIDKVKVCFHSQTDDCHCRKPRPGLLLETIKEYNIDPHRSFMIGDRWSDVLAGNAVNCSTIFLERGYSEHEEFSADYLCRNLTEAATYILNLN